MIQGLTTEEVKKQKKVGLSNERLDTFSPSYFKIVRRNLFSLMNIILIPLIGVLVYFDLVREVLVFTVFVIVNTILNSFEEIRVKKRLEKLKHEFQQRVIVIRDGVEQEIPVGELVKGDFVKASEGEGVVADGVIIEADYLQIDISALTGESDYLPKSKGDQILSGSFIVTGNCTYEITKIGKDNYLNKVGQKTLSFKKQKSKLERKGEYFVTFFVVSGVIAALINYYFSKAGGANDEDILLSITTLTAMIIPQTLIFLYSLTFVISITKLANKGILVQKRGAIDDLAGIDTICIDKTGTITTNKMKVIDAKYFNITEQELGTFYTSVEDKLHGKNKTSQALKTYFSEFEKIEVNNLEQVPFTSKAKHAKVEGIISLGNKKNSTGSDKEERTQKIELLIGAPSILISRIKDEKLQSKLKEYIFSEQAKGLRIIMMLYNSNGIGILSIQESLNPGIKKVIQTLKEQEIDVRIISGDSPSSVKSVAEKIGLENFKVFDLSEIHNSEDIDTDWGRIVKEYQIFTRATPEDKLNIIEALKKEGRKIAMIGDGINDVLGMKHATVSIAMEKGSKITRDIADIVLLRNDYRKIPDIFYEGDNIVFNLKLSTKIYFTKAIVAYVLTLYFAAIRETLPILPSTTLIFSFLGGTFPSYIVSFTRQQVKNQKTFARNILASGLPSGIVIGLITIWTYIQYNDQLNFLKLNTFLCLVLLALSLIYSIFLLYQAGKVTDWLIILIIGFFGMFYGVFQTILPFYLYLDDIPKMIFLIYMGLWATAVVYYVLNKFSNESPYMKKVTYVVTFVHFLVAVFYPCRLYYATEPVPYEHFIGIFFASCLGAIGIILVHKLPKVFKLEILD